MTRCYALLWVALIAYGIAVDCRSGVHREVTIEERDIAGRWVVDTRCRCQLRCYRETSRVQ